MQVCAHQVSMGGHCDRFSHSVHWRLPNGARVTLTFKDQKVRISKGELGSSRVFKLVQWRWSCWGDGHNRVSGYKGLAVFVCNKEEDSPTHKGRCLIPNWNHCVKSMQLSLRRGKSYHPREQMSIIFHCCKELSLSTWDLTSTLESIRTSLRRWLKKC